MVVDVGDVDIGTLLVDVGYVVNDLGVFPGLFLLVSSTWLLLTSMLTMITSRCRHLSLRVSMLIVSLCVDIYIRNHCLLLHPSGTIWGRCSLIGVIVRLVCLHIDLVALARSCRSRTRSMGLSHWIWVWSETSHWIRCLLGDHLLASLLRLQSCDATQVLTC